MLYGCTALPGELAAVAAAGFDYAELPCRAVTAMTEAEFAGLARAAARIIPVPAMNLYCPPEIVMAGPGFDLAAAADYARRASVRAQALGVRLVGIGSPRSRSLPEGYDRGLAVRQLSAFLAATADAFGGRDITVCLEALGPCFCNFVQRIGEAADIVGHIGHPRLALVLDFYNMEHSGEADLDPGPYLPRIAHAHISDDDGAPGRRSYLHPEKAALHRARIRRLRDRGYGGALTLEMDVPVDPERAKASLAVMGVDDG